MTALELGPILRCPTAPFALDKVRAKAASSKTILGGALDGEIDRRLGKP
ncbi:MAG: hypothetical protein ACLS3Y_06075 [Collinsella sp.]